MKKSISISGIACANLMMFGSMFKVMHWPGASPLLILAAVLFCFVFLPMALVNSYQRPEQKKYKPLHIVTFIVFFIGVMGILFKVMHWPGASIFLLLGVLLPFVLFLPVYLYQTRNEKKNPLNFSGIMFGMTFLAVFSVLLAINVSRQVIENAAGSIRNNEKFAQFLDSRMKNRSADNKIKQQSDELCSYIDALKCELLAATENNFCPGNKPGPDYDPSKINNRENADVPANILLGEGTQNKLSLLKEKLNSFRKSLLSSGNPSPELTELINGLFDASDKASENNEKISWEENQFKTYQLIFVLDALSQIQSNVRLVESEILTAA